MTRRKQFRTITARPTIQGFKPFGKNAKRKVAVNLELDEFEALRLMDYEKLQQGEAADRMNVSRATLARIYENARRKIATSLVEGNELYIQGGDVVFHGDSMTADINAPIVEKEYKKTEGNLG